MKDHLTFALASVAMLACALLALVGCGQADMPQESLRNTTEISQSSGTMNVSFIDVGKGDCILVQADDAAVLIDTGFDDTADEVVAYLHEQGVNRLRGVVITHYDRDHVGGLNAIGKAINIDTVFLPGYEGADKNYRTAMTAIENLGVPALPVTEVQTLELNEAELTILPTALSYIPGSNGDEGNDNDLSLVVTLIFRDDSFLFAGDLEKKGIAAYLKNSQGHFDVLKMPHHGQKNSNTDDLLDEVQPTFVIVTDDPSSPADRKTLNLIEDVGAETYRTSTDGTIVITSDGSGSYSVSTR